MMVIILVMKHLDSLSMSESFISLTLIHDLSEMLKNLWRFLSCRLYFLWDISPYLKHSDHLQKVEVFDNSVAKKYCYKEVRDETYSKLLNLVKVREEGISNDDILPLEATEIIFSEKVVVPSLKSAEKSLEKDFRKNVIKEVKKIPKVEKL